MLELSTILLPYLARDPSALTSGGDRGSNWPDDAALACGVLWGEPVTDCGANGVRRQWAVYCVLRFRDFLVAGLLILAGSSFTAQVADAGRRGSCTNLASDFAASAGNWNGWGGDLANSRFQPQPGLTADDVPHLKLKWAFGLPKESSVSAQPSVVGGRLFIGTPSGTIYALNSHCGCVYWTYPAGAAVRSAVAVEKLPTGKWAVFFADVQAWVYSVDAETGTLLWKVKLKDHPAARITGSLAAADERLYVPMSSTEETWANDPAYPCCSFRGSLSALDLVTGRKIWQSYTISQTAKPYKTSRAGTELEGPAGAAIWSTPTIDRKRGLAYVATGNSYTGVDAETSDAVVAFDLATGKIVWSIQLYPKDNYIVGCPFHPNCPDGRRDDFDFGASPLLHNLSGGGRILIAAQKSGWVYGLDPDHEGKVVWRSRVGEGGVLGGIMWGTAADANSVYIAVSDRLLGRAGKAGLYALDPATGRQRWTTPAPIAPGNPAQSAAVTAIPGVVFSGSVNGHFRAYSSLRGQILWDFDTKRPFETVNGVPANGGSIDGSGAVVADGMVYTTSGFERDGGEAGNVLLAFSVDAK
jgi:polyvinyl alcohol dehydrogenase (cytochrome)